MTFWIIFSKIKKMNEQIDIKAVAPYRHPQQLNFKLSPYQVWKEWGGWTAPAHYPPRLLHGFAFRWELPQLPKHRGEARLRFVEPVSIHFDTFPDYSRYEIVPMVWDCWPKYFEMMVAWLKKHDVRTAIFTSRQTAERMQNALPDVNILWCPEAIDPAPYHAGKRLAERTIDVFEFGRSNERVIHADRLKHVRLDDGHTLRHITTRQGGRFIYTNEQLYDAMADARITIALPRSMTQPEMAGDIETLTQRYWECMLSRMVMLGHAPQELVDLIGYNPVIELREDIPAEDLITDVLSHISDYQKLVDHNRETALQLGTWSVRMKVVMDWLESVGYYVHG